MCPIKDNYYYKLSPCKSPEARVKDKANYNVTCSVAKCVWLFAVPRTAACQAPLSSTISQSLLRCMSIGWCCPIISSSAAPVSLWLYSFPAAEPFAMTQLFTSGSQSIGASASVFPMNIQDWFPLGLVGLISLLSKGLSSVFLQHHNSKASILWCSAFSMV